MYYMKYLLSIILRLYSVNWLRQVLGVSSVVLRLDICMMVSAVSAARGGRGGGRVLVIWMKDLSWASSFELMCGRTSLIVERMFLL